jgi:hypothetical protein
MVWRWYPRHSQSMKWVPCFRRKMIRPSLPRVRSMQVHSTAVCTALLWKLESSRHIDLCLLHLAPNITKICEVTAACPACRSFSVACSRSREVLVPFILSHYTRVRPTIGIGGPWTSGRSTFAQQFYTASRTALNIFSACLFSTPRCPFLDLVMFAHTFFGWSGTCFPWPLT